VNIFRVTEPRRMKSVIRLVLRNFTPGLNEIAKNTVYSNLRPRNSELLLNEFHRFLGKPGSMASSLCCFPIQAMNPSLAETFKHISDKRQDFLKTRSPEIFYLQRETQK
jgi:hypothetical protein